MLRGGDGELEMEAVIGGQQLGAQHLVRLYDAHGEHVRVGVVHDAHAQLAVRTIGQVDHRAVDVGGRLACQLGRTMCGSQLAAATTIVVAIEGGELVAERRSGRRYHTAIGWR